MNIRDYLQGDWDAVALIDGTLFAVNESHNALVSWARGGQPGADALISADYGTIDYFAVINDHLFFVYSGHDVPEDSQPEKLYGIDADLNWGPSSINPLVIDAYQDLFA